MNIDKIKSLLKLISILIIMLNVIIMFYGVDKPQFDIYLLIIIVPALLILMWIIAPYIIMYRQVNNKVASFSDALYFSVVLLVITIIGVNLILNIKNHSKDAQSGIELILIPIYQIVVYGIATLFKSGFSK